MSLRILSVTGEALNFGGRRMETIARVAWLPVALILIVNMATVFAYLSVIAGRVITFSDVPTYFSAQQYLVQLAARGWENDPTAMWTITGVNLILQGILVASFMAPLIRYAGLGEKPRPGVVRLTFGPDQLRYVFAGIFSFLFVAILILTPTTLASWFVAHYIIEALSQTVASFPDPESLHTIEITTMGKHMTEEGAGWIFSHALPLAGVAPFALILWFIIYSHFHPKNRPNALNEDNPFLRAVVAFLAVAAFSIAVYLFARGWVLQNFMEFAALGGKSAFDFEDAPANVALFLSIIAYLLVNYVNLRLYPYPGIAVCRRSMSFKNLLPVTRGWNIIRLQVILILIAVFLILVQTWFINGLMLNLFLPWAINLLYQATAVSTRLVNSGVTGEWVLPVFVWTWNGIKILINLLWTFFSYGVAAGLYGRLYRESERLSQ